MNHLTELTLYWWNLAAFFYFAAVANFFGIVSCDFVEYDVPSGTGGSLGLFLYKLKDASEGSRPFTESTAEEYSFGPARTGAIAAFTISLCLLALNAIHYSRWAIPKKDVVFYVLGVIMQLSLALVQLMWTNELCETYGCRMGSGGSWTGVAHIMYLAATCISLFIDEPQHISTKGSTALRQQLYSITWPLVRQSSPLSVLEPQ